MHNKTCLIAVSVSLFSVMLSGCGTSSTLSLQAYGAFGEPTLEREVEPPVYGTLPGEKPLDIAKQHYRNGEFGLAEQSFRKAIELDNGNAEAWLGLAASYDRLRRFDQAKQAYDVLIKLVGHTPIVLNNLGYHYMLKGDHVTARATLASALEGDPENVIIQNNLDTISAESENRLNPTGG